MAGWAGHARVPPLYLLRRAGFIVKKVPIRLDVPGVGLCWHNGAGAWWWVIPPDTSPGRARRFAKRSDAALFAAELAGAWQDRDGMWRLPEAAEGGPQ